MPFCLKCPESTIIFEGGLSTSSLLIFSTFLQYLIRWLSAILIGGQLVSILTIGTQLQHGLLATHPLAQQVLFMKINFDRIAIQQSYPPHSSALAPIKVAVESPVYSSVVREVSPHNYRTEISSINSIIDLPQEVSRFIEKQVQKQIQSSHKSQVDQQPVVNIVERTSSEINLLKPNPGKYFFKQQQPKSKKTNPLTKTNTTTTINYKKHKRVSHIPTEVRQTLNEVSEFTCRPSLYQSIYNKKVEERRKMEKQENGMMKKYSVYDHLYKQAKDRGLKAQLNKVKQSNRIPEPRPSINTTFFQHSKTLYDSLYNRMDKILQSRQIKRREKQGLDLTTGRQLFIPDTSFSKESYKIFFHSLSKEKIKVKNNKNAKLEFTLKANKQSIHETSIKEQKKKQNPIDSKTVQYFTEIFYSQNQPPASLTGSVASNPIKKSQFLVLHSFLHQIEELESKKYEMQTTVSSAKASVTSPAIKNVLSKQEFQEKFKKYYEKLSLHDRQILRKEVVKRRRNQFPAQHQQPQAPISTFRPIINARSSSLDNLANGHSKNIYFI